MKRTHSLSQLKRNAQQTMEKCGRVCALDGVFACAWGDVFLLHRLIASCLFIIRLASRRGQIKQVQDQTLETK